MKEEMRTAILLSGPRDGAFYVEPQSVFSNLEILSSKKRMISGVELGTGRASDRSQLKRSFMDASL